MIRDKSEGVGIFHRSISFIARIAASCILALAPVSITLGEPGSPRAGETPIVFETNSGDRVDAYSGTLQVKENHDDPSSRMLTLHYVRFPANGEAPGSPIVYLAGGPGGSGIATAKWRRFPLFMAMREFGDVIALDQRGTGESNDLPNCRSPIEIDPAKPMPDQDYIAAYQEALRWCVADWQSNAIDLAGYTTSQSVRDLDALRLQLGAEALTLWGTSYGSHLALAAIKQLEGRIDRAVLSSVEGLNQTIKRPARTDAYFARLQETIDADPELRSRFPDIIALLRRVHTKLQDEPISVALELRDGQKASVSIQPRMLRQYSSGMISDPQNALRILSVYEALDRGDTGPAIALMSRWHRADNAISFRLMSTMMDVASGITADRRSMIEKEAETALLRTYLNFTLNLLDVVPEVDLGDAFRQRPVSDTPILVLSGTLDGRTYIESQIEATSGFSNRHAVKVANAGHNLFMASPEVTETIQDFMRGKDVDGRIITIDPPVSGDL